METIISDIREWNEETVRRISEAALVLRNGGLVAFPTETVYGLGADALNEVAVASIYEAKGRPSDNPLIVHVADIAQCKEIVAEWPKKAQKLAEAFWPGPLTMVLQKSDRVPLITTGGLATVAIRMPDHRAALELIRRAGCPVAAPSANLSGRPSPTMGSHVAQDLSGRIPVILAGSDCRIGIESTVLDLSTETPTILRPGILTPEAIEKEIGEKVALDPALLLQQEWEETKRNGGKQPPAPKAPGMKYKHYAPKAQMIIFRGEKEHVGEEMKRWKTENEQTGKSVGVIRFEEQSFWRAAHDLFAKLRELDDQGVDLILAEAVSESDSVGFAVMNRMLKSASYQVIDVKTGESR